MFDQLVCYAFELHQKILLTFWPESRFKIITVIPRNALYAPNKSYQLILAEKGYRVQYKLLTHGILI